MFVSGRRVGGSVGAGVATTGAGGDLRVRRAEIRVAALVVRKEARDGEGDGRPAAELGGVGREVCFCACCSWAAVAADAEGVRGRGSSWARSLAISSS
jgi:hypothetical protein